jgi:hypothetical protein
MKPTIIALIFFTILASPSQAIIIRHDRDDARYLELGSRYPAVCLVGRDGEGTLIAPLWVLTAAHVAADIPANSMTVTFDREYRIENIVIHPEWRDRGAHDLALIRLQEPVSGIEPVSIYTSTDEVGKIVTFVGRGDTGTGLTGPRVMDRKKRGATNKIESADERWLYFTFDDPPAATDLEGISGPGDSGGPALLEKDGKLYTLGVSSWGRPGKQGRGTYGAGEGYTRVSKYAQWIMRQTAMNVRATRGRGGWKSLFAVKRREEGSQHPEPFTANSTARQATTMRRHRCPRARHPSSPHSRL